MGVMDDEVVPEVKEQKSSEDTEVVPEVKEQKSSEDTCGRLGRATA